MARSAQFGGGNTVLLAILILPSRNRGDVLRVIWVVTNCGAQISTILQISRRATAASPCDRIIVRLYVQPSTHLVSEILTSTGFGEKDVSQDGHLARFTGYIEGCTAMDP